MLLWVAAHHLQLAPQAMFAIGAIWDGCMLTPLVAKAMHQGVCMQVPSSTDAVTLVCKQGDNHGVDVGKVLTEVPQSGGRTPHCCIMYTQSSPVDTRNMVRAALPA